jgi:hypothetical protein
VVWAVDDSETDLAKKTQNPVADLISVPFQNNFYFNSGTKDERGEHVRRDGQATTPSLPVHAISRGPGLLGSAGAKLG